MKNECRSSRVVRVFSSVVSYAVAYIWRSGRVSNRTAVVDLPVESRVPSFCVSQFYSAVFLKLGSRLFLRTAVYGSVGADCGWF